MQVVWFKRDLRVIDNVVLTHALQEGRVLPLYILEPDLWKMPDMSRRHYEFLMECLDELNYELSKLGQSLIFRVGDAVEVLQDLHKHFSITSLRSHQETWNFWTYQRDLRVKKWARENNIEWIEEPQHGVVRCLKNRDGWAQNWFLRMSQPIIEPLNFRQEVLISSDAVPTPEQLNLCDDGCIKRQKGGRSYAEKLLTSFLLERGADYTKSMSSPVTAFKSCSRLSPHISFGTLSLKEIFQRSTIRQLQIQELPKELRYRWPSALNSFLGRLHWHCHFIQKLEDNPRIEFENMHSAYNQVRHNQFNEQYFEAWRKGMTGYPMIDACMRALIATGWLNFRMRAMLMSFASYHLWLDWKKPALYLANLFTDYEPGIHYSQVQMQSGTTGINTLRIYNPVKQSIEHDPEGVFIKKWVPEIRHLTGKNVHTPWLVTEKVTGYPLPIINEAECRKEAASKLYTIRKSLEHKEESTVIVEKHASRKPTIRKKKPNTKSKNQFEFDF